MNIWRCHIAQNTNKNLPFWCKFSRLDRLSNPNISSRHVWVHGYGICKFHISAFVQACTFWHKLHFCIFRFASRHEFDAKTAFEAPFLPKISRNLNYIAQKYTDFLQYLGILFSFTDCTIQRTDIYLTFQLFIFIMLYIDRRYSAVVPNISTNMLTHG